MKLISTELNDNDKIAEFCKLTGLHPSLVNVLLQRGYNTIEEINKFLYPNVTDMTSPFLLTNMDKATDRIKQALVNKEKIVVYGDYDCDGIGATAIMCLALKEMGGLVNYFIPTRQDDGYGLSIDALQRVIDMFNPDLLITVDCGISSSKEVSFLINSNVDVIITDHHIPQKELPNCIVVNPKLTEGYSELCGAGVAFKIIEAMCGLDFALNYVDICAISTIADVVPLIGENRIIVTLGLEMLSKPNIRAGLRAILDSAGHQRRSKVTSSDVAYKIAPRLNASGRLSSAEKSLKLLLEKDVYIVQLLAQELEEENRSRQDLCVSTIRDANRMLKSYDLTKYKIVVLRNDEWEGGVIGIGASKIAEDYNLPTILLTEKEGNLKGSCRSIKGINIFLLLDYCKDFLIQYGGHSMAAGLSLKIDALDGFLITANKYIAKFVDQSCFEPSVTYNAHLPITDINLSLVEQLARFEPFGMSNSRPNFASKVTSLPLNIISNTNHLKAKLGLSTSLIAFNKSILLQILSCPYLDKLIVFSLDIDTFNNSRTAKCSFKDYELDITTNNESLSDNLNSDNLRKYYKEFKVLIDNKRFGSLEKLYKEVCDGFSGTKEEFFVSYFIFREVKLIDIVNNCIMVYNKKVNLEDSLIFTKLRGYNG